MDYRLYKELLITTVDKYDRNMTIIWDVLQSTVD